MLRDSLHNAKRWFIREVHNRSRDRWLPPSNAVKLNVDAAVTNTSTTLVIVARDAFGEVLMTSTNQNTLCDPLQAEAAAFLWHWA